jgi:hypothetical protein
MSRRIKPYPVDGSHTVSLKSFSGRWSNLMAKSVCKERPNNWYQAVQDPISGCMGILELNNDYGIEFSKWWLSIFAQNVDLVLNYHDFYWYV